MGIETASYISDLDSANPTSLDSISQMDDHLRLVKTVLKATFPNLDGPVTGTPENLNNPVPSGAIILLANNVAIPTGYVFYSSTDAPTGTIYIMKE